MAKKVRRKKGAAKAATPTYENSPIKESRPDTRPALIALLLVVLLIGSGLYLTSIIEEAPEVSYGVNATLLTDMHNAEPGASTDFIVIVRNIGSITDTFQIGVKSNDGGFNIEIEEGYQTVTVGKDERVPIIVNVETSSSASGLLYAYLEVRSTNDITKSSDVKLNVNTDYDFGNQTVTGNSVEVHYAGILASNAKLFDSSMEYIWDNYMHRKDGVSEGNRHTDTLPADNIGCDGEGYPSENCKGSRGMIKGFDNKMVGMYEGQHLAIRIPAKDAYGETGAHDLAGQDLIFEIEMVAIS